MVYDINAALKYPDTMNNALSAYSQGQKFRQQKNQNALMDARKGYGRNSLAAGGEFSPESYLQAYAADAARAGDFEALTSGQKAYGDFQKQQADFGKTQAETRNIDFEGALKKTDLISRLLGGARDQATWEASRRQAEALGIDVSDTPLQYNPRVVSDLQQMALSAQQRLEQMWRQRDYDLSTSKFDYQQQNDAQNRAVTLRGQNMTDARARAANDLKRQEVAQAPGGGLGIAAKATEDERKAAGWLSQARKASEDMAAALVSDPDAAVPGLLEAYSPSIEIANRAMSPARQRYAQGASAFAEATLRAATGAGVTREEAAQKIRELTPQRGDSSDVVKQKIASQKVYLQSLEARAGRATPTAYQGVSGSVVERPGWTSDFATLKDAHADYVAARREAYRLGDMSKVKAIDAAARADGVIR